MKIDWDTWRIRFDTWRIIPRVLIALYGWMCYTVADWFMNLPEPSMSQVTFVSTVWGAAAAWFNFYVNSGNTDVKSNSNGGSSSSSPSSGMGRIQERGGGGEE